MRDRRFYLIAWPRFYRLPVNEGRITLVKQYEPVIYPEVTQRPMGRWDYLIAARRFTGRFRMLIKLA